MMPPQTFGPKLRAALIRKLNQEVEGSCSGQHGYIIMVTSVDEISPGYIRDGTAMVSYEVQYKAVVFRPFRNEVLDAVVTTVSKQGFFAEAGPLQMFVAASNMPSNLVFEAAATPQKFQSEDGIRIQQGDLVRLKIAGIRVDAQQIVRVLCLVVSGSDCCSSVLEPLRMIIWV